jgi:hypothetical protein
MIAAQGNRAARNFGLNPFQHSGNIRPAADIIAKENQLIHAAARNIIQRRSQRITVCVNIR